MQNASPDSTPSDHAGWSQRLLLTRFASKGEPFPPDRVSALPSELSWTHLLPRRRAVVERSVLSYCRSRYALTDALRACGVAAGTPVLLPALHCLTMVDPVVRLGAQVLLYPLTTDLKPDYYSVERLLSGSRVQIKAMLLPHYFGLQQDVRLWAAWAADRGISLVEDCSHCLPGLRSRGVGTTGRFSIWSPYKFYPCHDGGELTAGDVQDLTHVQAPRGAMRSTSAQVRLAAQWASKCMARRRSICRVEQLDAEIASALPHSEGCGVETMAAYDAPSEQYQIPHELQTALWVSRWITSQSATEPIADRRRMRWRQWCAGLDQSGGVTPIRENLGDDDVPYMFPMYVPYPEVAYFLLRRLGIAVWRWDSMAMSDCAVASRYRLSLFQLPCHQDINDAEMAWLIAAVNRVMNVTQKPQ